MVRYSSHHDEKEARALLIGALLILFVGGYFIVRTFFFGEKKNDTSLENTSLLEDSEKNGLIISPDVVRQKILNHEPIVFLDLRPAELFESEHIPNSLSLSLEALSTFVPDPNDILVIVYSRDDVQTYEIAKNIIKERSLTAFFLDDGFEGWKSTSNQTISTGDPNSFVDQSKVVYIDAPELLKLMNTPTTDLVIIDVQAAANFERLHIKNAINIPLDQLEKRVKDIPSNTPLVVYGENEFVSFQAGVRLADLNIFTAKTLSGNKNLTSESKLPLAPETK